MQPMIQLKYDHTCLFYDTTCPALAEDPHNDTPERVIYFVPDAARYRPPE